MTPVFAVLGDVRQAFHGLCISTRPEGPATSTLTLSCGCSRAVVSESPLSIPRGSGTSEEDKESYINMMLDTGR